MKKWKQVLNKFESFGKDIFKSKNKENIVSGIKVTEFAERHFEKSFSGTRINIPVQEFEQKLNNRSFIVKDGYAPFCKLLVYENFTDAKCGTAEITLENSQYLKSGYSSRKKDELQVLSRWLQYPERRFIPTAKYLVVVVYDKEQLEKEFNEGPQTNMKDFNREEVVKFEFDGDWGVVAILAQESPEEEPMSPMTMLRNALGKDEGGSGVKLDKSKYEESVRFWKTHAIVR